jgi:TonB family protein
MTKSILFFSSVSVLTHIVIIGTLYNQVNNSVPIIPHKKLGGITISVDIRKDNVAESSSVKTRTSARRYELKFNDVTQKKKNKVNLKPISIQQSLTSIIENNDEHQNSDVYDGETLSKLLSTEFSKYFYYPKAAQRRNWQGEVILRFVIEGNGAIKQVQVSKSSGYDLLDNAAMVALKKIKTNNSFSLALGGQSVEQELPVIYRITR